MKFVGIVGSIAEDSYNLKLMKFIAKHYQDLADFEILDIKNVPIFCEDRDITDTEVIQNLKRKIEAADGVIIATPEHNHTITAALKSVLEWLSYKIHPLEEKPVMIVGASYFTQGSSRAQLDLREILEAPGVGAIVMPGNEFLLENAKEAFDDQGDLMDEGTVNFLTTVMKKFVRWVNVINAMDLIQLADDKKEDEAKADTGASASVTEEEDDSVDTNASASVEESDDEEVDTSASASTTDEQTDDEVDTDAYASVQDDADDNDADTGASASVK